MRLIVTLILIYFLFRLLTAYVFPWIARWYLRQYREKFFRDNPGAARASEKRKSDPGYQHRRKTTGRPDTDKLGEYIDYEEITDDETDKQNNN